MSINRSLYVNLLRIPLEWVRSCRCLTVLLFLVGLQMGVAPGVGADVVQVALSRHFGPGDRYMGIRLLGTLNLPGASVDGLTLGGLSDLAWDEDEALLYAIADTAGLFHLRPRFNDNGMLIDVELHAGHVLRDAIGRPLSRPWSDAEGLTLENGANGVRGDSRLLVSFERQPRIQRHAPDGEYLGSERLPGPLATIERYASGNKGLESLVLHPTWGLLTAPEKSLRAGPRGRVPIYALNGRFWWYPLHAAPRSSLVAMEALPDGSLLTLERAFVSLVQPLIISLRRAYPAAAGNGPIAVEDIAVMDTSEGWLLDNFEGLSHHRNGRFFMVSDDNRRALQSTLLVYFELLPSVDTGRR